MPRVPNPVGGLLRAVIATDTRMRAAGAGLLLLSAACVALLSRITPAAAAYPDNPRPYGLALIAFVCFSIGGAMVAHARRLCGSVPTASRRL